MIAMEIKACGDSMLLVECGDAIDPVINERTITLARIGTGSPPMPSSSRYAVKLAQPSAMSRMRLRSRRSV